MSPTTTGPPASADAASPSARGARPRIGDVLVHRGLVTPHQLADAIEVQRETGERLGEILVRTAILDPVDLTRALAEHLDTEFVDLDRVAVDRMTAQCLPRAFSEHHQVLPIAREGRTLVVAFADVNDVFALDDTAMVTGEEIRQVLAEPGQLRVAIERAWDGTELTARGGELAADLAGADGILPDDPGEAVDQELALADAIGSVEDAPIVRYVNALIAEAADQRASDIHLEPTTAGLRVRFRVDGVLHDASSASASQRAGVVSRLKVMAGIDIAQRRLPQDGRLSVTVAGRPVDIRVTTVPTARGEAVVLRLLDRARGPIALDDVGLLPAARAVYERELHRAQGTILLTGPTGSGKSTTLYASLREVDHAGIAVVTVEDPVEYRMEGIKQVQIARAAGLTFPVALRSLLRADPDVILVGEIRDRETAKIAAEAALTGHLVLASIHTNDAPSTPMRLVEMGVEPYLIASALSCVVGQRLVRRLCEQCRTPVALTPDDARHLGWPEDRLDQAPDHVHREVGCPACHHTGFRGRVGVFEVMPITEPIERLIASGASSRELREQAIGDGMVTIRQSGLLRVAEGLTSTSELVRAVPR